MKKVNVGGQAVIEGVMMKNESKIAVAVRKPDKEIIIDKKEFISYTKRHKVLGVPFIRGVVNFVESLVIGMKTLTYSAEFFEAEEEIKQSKFEKKLEDKFGKDKLNDILIGFSVVLAVIFSVGLFVILPLFLTQLLEPYASSWTINLADGILRIVIFLGYLWLISKMKDIQRIFEYHGAEHKSIHCLESGEELTVENIKKHSRLHKRCGTNFMFIVVLISILIITLVNVSTFWVRLVVRLLLLPVIAGISYEVLKQLGKHESRFSDIVSYPGLMLQKLTTREPDDEQIEVAIASLKGVLQADGVDNTESA